MFRFPPAIIGVGVGLAALAAAGEDLGEGVEVAGRGVVLIGVFEFAVEGVAVTTGDEGPKVIAPALHI